MKKFILAIVLIIALIGSFIAGYAKAIHDVELIEVTENEYSIDFDGQVHNYSWEVNK